MFNKILLAADGSDHSIRAADKAIYVANLNPDAVIHIVYVLDETMSKTEVLHQWNQPDMSLHRKETIKPIEDKVKAAGVSYETKFLRGDPGPTLVDYANENELDLVVIGSRGLNALQQFVLGSVSHKVAKRANGCVMIVK